MSWRFRIEVRRPDGELVGVADASAGHCVEDALFQSVRCGELANDGRLPAPTLEPRFEADHPTMTGLCIAFAGLAPRHYGRDTFACQARELIRRLQTDDVLGPGEDVLWNVVAREAMPPPSGSIRTTRQPFPLEAASLPHVAEGGYGVCIQAGVLRRLHDRVRATGALEGAELLLGRLRHDADRISLELCIEDALSLTPGRGGHSTTHFAFDPAAFLAARRAAQARGDGLLPCGWHHNHNPCPGCLAKPDCPVDWVFFSEDDLGVQATLFPSPHMVALVGGKTGALPASRPGFRLYGWRRALVEERCFRVAGPGAEDWDPKHGAFRAPAHPEEDVAWPTS